MGDTEPHDGHRCVARVPIFATLTPADQDLLTALARPTTLAAGEELYGSLADTPRLLVVHSGRLIVHRTSVDGGERVLRVLGPGDFSGEQAVLTGTRAVDDVRATELTQLCVFEHRDITAQLSRHPAVALRMLASLVRRLGVAEDRIASLTSRDVTARLADYLLELPGHINDGAVYVELPIAKKDLASLLDTTAESLSRALARLAYAGMVAVDGSRITLLDVDSLARRADG